MIECKELSQTKINFNWIDTPIWSLHQAIKKDIEREGDMCEWRNRNRKVVEWYIGIECIWYLYINKDQPSFLTQLLFYFILYFIF